MSDFKLQQVLKTIKEHEAQGADGMILFSNYNRYWFLEFASSDGFVFINKDGKAIYLVDARYYTAASETVKNAKVILLARTPQKSTFNLLKDAMVELNITNALVEADYVTLDVHEMLKKLVKNTTPFTSATLRAIKTEKELEYLQKAADIAALTCNWIREQDIIGRTELEIATLVSKHMLELGGELNSFDPIIASGPNGGSPHHHPGNRVIEDGDMVTVDIGCTYKGYCSDITRSFIVGNKANPQMQEIYDKVLESQTAGINLLSTKVTGQEVDKVCRDIVDNSKFKGYFTHGTGHGVGLQVHELPNTNAGNPNKLPLNAVVTVEPGIYIPNVGGVRIEDTIVVKDGQALVLTRLAYK